MAKQLRRSSALALLDGAAIGTGRRDINSDQRQTLELLLNRLIGGIVCVFGKFEFVYTNWIFGGRIDE